MFPIYSRIKDNNQRFSNAYLQVAATIALITFPLMAGLMTLAEAFVYSSFGSKWEPSILLIMILAPIGLLQSIGTTVGSIYQAKARTDWMLKMGIIGGSLFVMSFIIGLKWGVIGVATAYAITASIIWYPALVVPFRLIDLRFSSLLKVLWQPLINSLMMMIVIIIFKAVLPVALSSTTVLGFSILLGIAVYSVASWISNRGQLEKLWYMAGFARKPVSTDADSGL
jgi:O-antigen/teichoic acid export membrane protein